MTEPTQDSAVAYAIALLVHYGFEMGGYKAEELVAKWLNDYQANWVRLAVIEALYQGRYKSISVEQILAFWKRRDRALYHFNHEFERLICRKFPQNLTHGITDETLQLDSLEELEIVEMPNYASVVSEQQSELTSRETDTSSQSVGEMHASSVSLAIPPLSPNPLYPLLAPGLTPVEQDNSPPEPLADIQEPTQAIEQQISDRKIKYEADWSRSEAGKRPIGQFTPTPPVSDFYLKLKAVAQLREDLIEEDTSLQTLKSASKSED